MATIKKHFYVAKGENDRHPWLYYGEKAPIITHNGESASALIECDLIGSFADNPIGDSIKDNEIVKIYIRKETKKNK